MNTDCKKVCKLTAIKSLTDMGSSSVFSVKSIKYHQVGMNVKAQTQKEEKERFWFKGNLIRAISCDGGIE